MGNSQQKSKLTTRDPGTINLARPTIIFFPDKSEGLVVTEVIKHDNMYTIPQTDVRLSKKDFNLLKYSSKFMGTFNGETYTLRPIKERTQEKIKYQSRQLCKPKKNNSQNRKRIAKKKIGMQKMQTKN